MSAQALESEATLDTSVPLSQAPAEAIQVPICDLDQGTNYDTTRPFIHTTGATAASSTNRNLAPAVSRADLGFVNGLAIVLGLQIGSGIFSAPSQVSTHVSSPGVGVLIWLFAGVFVWTGAASFIELGLAIPINGGIQEYLRHCYGDFLGFLFTSTWVLLCKPAAMAIIAIVFSDHLCHAVLSDDFVSAWASKGVAVSGISLVTVVNCIGAKTGPKAANVFLILKIIAVYSIILVGLATIIKGKAAAMNDEGFGWFQGSDVVDTPASGSGAWFWLGEYVTAFYGALFCFAGWESVSVSTRKVFILYAIDAMITSDRFCGRRTEESR